MYFHVEITERDGHNRPEVKLDLSEEQVRQKYINPYLRGESIVINGKTISAMDIYRIRVSQSELESHATILILKQKDENSHVVLLGGPSYRDRVIGATEDVTDCFVTGPAGSENGSIDAFASATIVDGARPNNKVFVVHGHDLSLKDGLELLLRRVNLQPVVLHREVDEGLTVIEKFEKHSDVNYAVVLLTPDDIVQPTSNQELGKARSPQEYRARQNVVFELGFFVGKLGRSRVACLYKSGVALPSDLQGLMYKKINDRIDEIEYALIREFRNAGLPVAE